MHHAGDVPDPDGSLRALQYLHSRRLLRLLPVPPARSMAHRLPLRSLQRRPPNLPHFKRLWSAGSSGRIAAPISGRSFGSLDLVWKTWTSRWSRRGEGRSQTTCSGLRGVDGVGGMRKFRKLKRLGRKDWQVALRDVQGVLIQMKGRQSVSIGRTYHQRRTGYLCRAIPLASFGSSS